MFEPGRAFRANIEFTRPNEDGSRVTDNYVEPKRTDGSLTVLRFVWRRLPRNGGRALLLVCSYCNTPRRHVYGWEWDSSSGKPPTISFPGEETMRCDTFLGSRACMCRGDPVCHAGTDRSTVLPTLLSLAKVRPLDKRKW